MGWALMVIDLVAVPLLSLWGYVLARRHGRYKFLPWLAPAGLLVSTTSLCFVISGLVAAFKSVGSGELDPSEKAELLSAGISEAMAPGAFLLLLGVGLCVASLVANIVVQLKMPPPADPKADER